MQDSDRFPQCLPVYPNYSVRTAFKTSSQSHNPQLTWSNTVQVYSLHSFMILFNIIHPSTINLSKPTDYLMHQQV